MISTAKLAFATLLILSCCKASLGDSNTKRSEWRLSLTIAGLALMAGGGSLAYLQNEAADRDMAIYRNSAFTENTTKYRDKVRRHEAWTWAGLGGMALGGVLVVVSF